MSTKTNTPIKSIAVGLAAGALALGGYAIGNSNSGSSATAAVPQAAQTGQAAPTGKFGAGGGPRGFGTAATGAAADKAKAAALAKYSGTVQTVMKLNDGSYMVHVVTSNGELHVLVSKDFKVTGTQQGPPAGAGPGAQGSAPAPQAGGTTSTS
jgi:hypothetical protein